MSRPVSPMLLCTTPGLYTGQRDEKHESDSVLASIVDLLQEFSSVLSFIHVVRTPRVSFISSHGWFLCLCDKKDTVMGLTALGPLGPGVFGSKNKNTKPLSASKCFMGPANAATLRRDCGHSGQIF